MIIDLSPYEIFLIGCCTTGYVIYDRLERKKFNKILRALIFAIGLKPESFDLK